MREVSHTTLHRLRHIGHRDQGSKTDHLIARPSQLNLWRSDHREGYRLSQIRTWGDTWVITNSTEVIPIGKNGFEHKELAIFELKLKWVS